MRTLEDAKRDLLIMLPHLRYAVETAALEGTVELGVLSTKPDGSGRLQCRFEAPGFVEDLALLLGAGPMTAEDRQEAAAQSIVDQFTK
jgi:hypothetical protein